MHIISCISNISLFSDQEPFSGKTTGDFDKEFSGKGYYNLTRLYCSPPSGRERRSVAIDNEEASHDGLLYGFDEGKFIINVSDQGIRCSTCLTHTTCVHLSHTVVCHSLSTLLLYFNLHLLLPSSPPADADQKRMNRLRRSVQYIPNALGDLHKNPSEHKIGEMLGKQIQ